MRELARRAGSRRASVHRIWRSFDPQPWRIGDFTISPDPLLIDKIRDVAGPYLPASRATARDRWRAHGDARPTQRRTSSRNTPATAPVRARPWKADGAHRPSWRHPRRPLTCIGLPVILLIASKGKGSSPDVAGYAAFGLTITAWASYGVRLVAARESGLLKRWKASPLPRWCYFAAAVAATTIAAVIAGGIAVAVALLLWGSHFGAGPSVQLTGRGAAAILIVFTLAALAWASAATAITSIIPTVEAAFPTLTLIYFPLVIISGVLFSLNEPHWLSTLVSYLPAQPMIDAAVNAVHHGPGVPFIPARDAAVLAAWAAGGLLVAILTFRWEPHRPHGHAGSRPRQTAS